MENLNKFLNLVKNNINPNIFVSGECHTLAFMLTQRFSGKMIAIIRKEVDFDSNKTFSITYSHMVFEDKNGICWDIDGDFADVRWVEQWSEEPDEDNLVSIFEYVDVDILELSNFLQSHNVKNNEKLFQELDKVYCSFFY